MSDEDLKETQAEAQAVKRALREESSFLGMTGETLQKYLIQLMEKQNLLRSSQRAPAAEAARLAALAAPAAQAHAQGGGGGGLQPEHRQPPGPPTEFDRGSLPTILAHMFDYEASALESVKSLRALASLASFDADFVTEDSRVLPQVAHLTAIHRGTPQVKSAAMKFFCNLAYDPDTALKRMTDTSTLRAILDGMDRSDEFKETALLAGEAAARMIAAEVCEPGETVGQGTGVRTVSASDLDGFGAIGGFFLSACTGSAPHVVALLQLCEQLVTNEVATLDVIARGFVAAAAPACVSASPAAAAVAQGWLSLAKRLSAEDALDGLPDRLVEAGCIGACARMMQSHMADAALQFLAMEAMSSLIGSRAAGLTAFAQAQGMRHIIEALQTHRGAVALQTKGLRALSCGVAWPPEVQLQAGFTHKVGIELTKVAMTQHPDDVDLQVAALEALLRYSEAAQFVDDIKSSGGEGLVKALMVRHFQAERMQLLGKRVFDALGGDRQWQPQNIAPTGAAAA